MSLLKYILPVAAVAQVALAQGSPCGKQGATTTVQNAADATAIAGFCQTYTGSIAIATGAAQAISFNGQLSQITENLIANNATSMTELSADHLQSIGGDFVMQDLTVLYKVDMPQLNRIDGKLSWTTLPALPQLTFGQGVQRISEVSILNTQIQDLSNINLKSASSVRIGQNARLSKMSWQLTQVEKSLRLDSNGQANGFMASFPNLETAGEIIVNKVSDLALNSLKNVTGTFSVDSAPLMGLAAPNLTLTKDFVISNAAKLSNISFPLLRRVSALNLKSLPELKMNISFPSLERIGSINASSDAFSALTFPKLNTIEGAVFVRSSGDINPTTCKPLDDAKSQGQIMTKVDCTSTNPTKSGGGNGGNSGDSTNSGSGSQTSNPAAHNYAAVSGALLGTTGLLAAMLGMF